MQKHFSILNQQANQKRAVSPSVQKENSHFFKSIIQPKLTINQPNDLYEHEADAMADKVMRMTGNESVHQPFFRPAISFVQRKCEHCEEEEKKMQRKESCTEAVVAPSTESYISSLSGGRTLSKNERSFFETRMGYDFSEVKIYDDSNAHESARNINALAYTHGNNIVFGANQFSTENDGGKKLLAHELAHTIQQNTSVIQANKIQRQLLPPIPIMIDMNAPMEVNAVDARQETSIGWYNPARYTGPIANFFRGDVTMTGIEDMVNHVLVFLRGRRMQRLNIMDHGYERGAQIGDDWILNVADVARFGGQLRRLRSSFAGNAIVHMQNCHIGQDQPIICALAAAFGVPVFAGTGFHNPVFGFNTGDYVSCGPAGNLNPNAGRPSTPVAPRQNSEA